MTCRFIIGSPRLRGGLPELEWGRVRAAPERSASPRLFSSLKIGLNSPWQLVSWTRRALRQSARFTPDFTRSTCTSPRTCAHLGSALRLAQSGAPCAPFSQTPKRKGRKKKKTACGRNNGADQSVRGTCLEDGRRRNGEVRPGCAALSGSRAVAALRGRWRWSTAINITNTITLGVSLSPGGPPASQRLRGVRQL